MMVIFLLLLFCLTTCASSESGETTLPDTSDSSALARRQDTLPGADTTDPVAFRGPVPPDTLYIAEPDYDTTQWTEVISLDSSIVLDLRYATDNNFVGEPMYDCGRCFLRPPVARAIVRIHHELQQQGLGLKMFDCYRPRPIQWKLWNKVPDARFVADPRKGSVHNRGAAVDLTIVDARGQELPMGTAYDYFGREAYQSYQQLSDSVLANRRLLKETMERHGFRAIRTEWWHYNFPSRSYPLSDMVWNCPE